MRRLHHCAVWQVERERERRSRDVCGRCRAPDRLHERQAQRRTHSGDGGTGAGGGIAPTAVRARKREGVRGRSRPAAAWQALARASAPGRRHANGPPPADRGAKAQGGKSRARAAPPQDDDPNARGCSHP